VPSYTGYLIETLVTLLAVCALAFLVLKGARGLGIGRPTGPIELQGHLPLDGRRAIYLVRVGAQVFVVGVGEGGFAKLGEIPASELPAAPAMHRAPFAETLARVLLRNPQGSRSPTPDRSKGTDGNPAKPPSSERG
jgi:flagellar biogenesis protein FliO